MKFKIAAVDSNGVHHDETMEATDNPALIALVKEKNWTLIRAEEIKTSSGPHWFSFKRIFGHVKIQEKINFARNLGSMLDAGLAVSRALSVIEKQTKHKRFKQIVGSINTSISQGHTLSESMMQYKDVFPSLMTSMVKAGEESGSLAQSLREVGMQMDNSNHLTKKIKGAMMYPMIIMFAMIIIGFFMLTFVVPTLASTFKSFGAQLPLATRIVIGASDFLKSNIILSILVIVGFFAAIFLGLRTVRGRRMIDFILLHVPVIGVLNKEINSARTARTLSSLLNAGVDIVLATQITADVVQNSYYKQVLKLVEQKIQKGEPIADIFSAREDLYPVFVGEMISVGEETGQVAQMLLGVAVFYENEVDQKTKDLSSIVEPILMIVIGLAVGFFAISMISPIYSLSSSIG